MKKAEDFSRMVKALRVVLDLWEEIAPEYERMMSVVEEGEAALAATRQASDAERQRLKGQLDALGAGLEKTRVEMKAEVTEYVARLREAEALALKAQEKADAAQRETSELLARARSEQATATAGLLAERTTLQQEVEALRRAVAAAKKSIAELRVEV